MQAGVDACRIAARFHNGLVRALAETADRLCHERELDTVTLSGAVFQNRFLFEKLHAALRAAGLLVLAHRRTPCNDGGLALGQALIAARQLTPD